MWIYGPAGGGKSAIMQTMAELPRETWEFSVDHSFSFARTNKRNEKTHLITTLAYQLSLNCYLILMTTLQQQSTRTHLFSHRTLAVQMKELILNPMSAAANHDPHSSQWCYTMLVDGLDECSPPESHHEIITLLSSSVSSHLRFVTASHPEFIIRDTLLFLKLLAKQWQSLVLDNTYSPDDDIKFFLTDKFQDIKARHPAQHSIPNSWPESSIINTLVKNSSGQFIYAATVIKFVESHEPQSYDTFR